MRARYQHDCITHGTRTPGGGGEGACDIFSSALCIYSSKTAEIIEFITFESCVGVAYVLIRLHPRYHFEIDARCDGITHAIAVCAIEMRRKFWAKEWAQPTKLYDRSTQPMETDTFSWPPRNVSENPRNVNDFCMQNDVVCAELNEFWFGWMRDAANEWRMKEKKEKKRIFKRNEQLELIKSEE